jgi:hypothetical protein
MDIKENTAKVNFSELFTGSKNVIQLTMANHACFVTVQVVAVVSVVDAHSGNHL